MIGVDQKVLLNLGSGRTHLTELGCLETLPVGDWQEVRVDLDEDAEPDVVADLRSLPFEDDYADAAISLGVLEHFEEPALPSVFGEIARVLKPGGVVKLVVPDMQAICAVIAEGRLTDVLFESSAGPVRALDIVYGYSPMLAEHPLWGHRTGFTAATLADWLGSVGFEGGINTDPDKLPYMLIAEAHKQ